MDRQTILRKIKACLRLAGSSNPTEAATALRQARAMMAAHGISEAEALDVDEGEAPTRARGGTPPQSIVSLAFTCAEGFGTQFVSVRSNGRTVLRFHGLHGAGEIASYAFTVLRRQLDADRLKHISRIRKRANRERRGEVFALAWVRAVAHLFPAAEVTDAARLAIEQAVAVRYPDKHTSKARDLTKRGQSNQKVDQNDHLAGLVAGAVAHLRNGIKGQSTPQQETLALEQLA